MSVSVRSAVLQLLVLLIAGVPASAQAVHTSTLGFLKDPLEDLCVSRPLAHLEWGIPLPFDDQYVTYSARGSLRVRKPSA